MEGTHILLVDDDDGLVEVLTMALNDAGFAVRSAPDGLAGWHAFCAEHPQLGRPELVLLDVMMPELDGLELCRRIRAHGDTLVVMLTSRDEDVDQIVALELGADDYVTKPFSVRVLIARMRALLRRRRGLPSAASDAAEERCRVGALRIDRARREIRYDDTEVSVTATEFELLWALASQPGRVLSRAQLMAQVYGADIVVADRTIDTFVKRLRHKLRRIDPPFDALQTVRGVGYRYRG